MAIITRDGQRHPYPIAERAELSGLSTEILLKIFRRLPAEDLCSVDLTCRKFKQLNFELTQFSQEHMLSALKYIYQNIDRIKLRILRDSDFQILSLLKEEQYDILMHQLSVRFPNKSEEELLFLLQILFIHESFLNEKNRNTISYLEILDKISIKYAPLSYEKIIKMIYIDIFTKGLRDHAKKYYIEKRFDKLSKELYGIRLFNQLALLINNISRKEIIVHKFQEDFLRITQPLILVSMLLSITILMDKMVGNKANSIIVRNTMNLIKFSVFSVKDHKSFKPLMHQGLFLLALYCIAENFFKFVPQKKVILLLIMNIQVLIQHPKIKFINSAMILYSYYIFVSLYLSHFALTTFTTNPDSYNIGLVYSSIIAFKVFNDEIKPIVPAYTRRIAAKLV
ncbi:MAG: hypothetical protein A3F40_01850 [Chlamydiae bacterium RIFCSPHIGHO2_12_FULL_27_8]|nr:MAG: hypothetical protein A3F40_01850 [Chlamydiae bacterium RIFCSPHIGHO2_12_FULL_27_8]